MTWKWSWNGPLSTAKVLDSGSVCLLSLLITSPTWSNERTMHDDHDENLASTKDYAIEWKDNT